MRYSTLFAFASVLALSACGGGGVTPIADGPLKLGIVAGQDQIAKAGTAQFSDPVIGRMVREQTADGRWRLHFEIVKTAHAQTTVTGSPVPGAVVCSATVEGSIEAFAVCTNTNENGEAVFFYEPGTEAGAQRAEIRGTLDNLPAVFDTVHATVEAGPATEIGQTTFGPIQAAAPVDLHENILTVRDGYGNFIYLKGDVGPVGTPNFLPVFFVRDGDTSPTAKWADSNEPRPAGTAGWVVPLTGWSGHRVTVFFWVGDAEAHFTVDVA